MHRRVPETPLPRIDLADQLDVAFWALVLDVSEREIREAVKNVGAKVDSVSSYLEGWPGFAIFSPKSYLSL